MSWAAIGGIAAPLLVFLAALAGYLLKQFNDKKERESREKKEQADREASDRKAQNELEAKRAQEAYENMQIDLTAARTEVRSLRSDLDKARTDMAQQQKDALDLWSKFAALRREMDSAEDHIADVHRWDENGRNGPMPPRPQRS